MFLGDLCAENIPPAKLPTAICMAWPVARLVDPARSRDSISTVLSVNRVKIYSLLLSQVMLPGKAGYSAHAAMNTPA
jgi:hypothetical protein